MKDPEFGSAGRESPLCDSRLPDGTRGRFAAAQSDVGRREPRGAHARRRTSAVASDGGRPWPLSLGDAPTKLPSPPPSTQPQQTGGAREVVLGLECKWSAGVQLDPAGG